PAERAGDEADPLGGEGEQELGEPVVPGEEERSENGRGEHPVDREVVPLQDGTDHAAGEHPLEAGGGAALTDFGLAVGDLGRHGLSFRSWLCLFAPKPRPRCRQGCMAAARAEAGGVVESATGGEGGWWCGIREC